jgi:hypothetical protein
VVEEPPEERREEGLAGSAGGQRGGGWTSWEWEECGTEEEQLPELADWASC